MRIAIVGAGGVGGYFAARLALAGEDVVLLARGQHLAAIQESGLKVRSLGAQLPVPTLHATDDPVGLPPVDAVLVATKSWQLETAVAGFRSLVGPNTLVVPLQNGVEAQSTLRRFLPHANVGNGLTRIISFIAGPGQIEHVGAEPYIALAAGSPEFEETAQDLVEALVGSGVAAEIPEDIDAALWKKFLFVASMGGVSSVCRAPLGVVRDQSGPRSMLRAAMEEIRAVGVAKGVQLPGDIVDKTLAFSDRLPPHGTASLQRDLESGRPSELEAWSGAVVRMGVEVGVPVPTHEFIFTALSVREQVSRGDLTLPTGPSSSSPLPLHSDQRGFVVEPGDGEDMAGMANCHAVLTRPGGVRGNHVHRRGYEVMTVVGPALVRARENGIVQDTVLEAGEARKFTFPPGVSHAVQNTGDDWGVLVAFNTVAHDPRNPDVERDILIEP